MRTERWPGEFSQPSRAAAADCVSVEYPLFQAMISPAPYQVNRAAFIRSKTDRPSGC
jgi:hypothetical protein